MFKNIFISLLVISASYILGTSARKTACRRLSLWAKRTPWRWDEAIVAVINRWSVLWTLLLGIYLASGLWHLPGKAGVFFNKSLITAFWVSFILALVSLSSSLISIYSDKIKETLPLTSLTQNITKVTILIIGGLMLLSALGISITPLLTTLGIGGLAVALALQDTLSNMFAGFYISIARQVRVGDFVRLESGEEGYVTDIGWRATRVRMLPNNIVLIPNAKLAQSVITNYYLPEKEMAVLVQVGVHYASDLKKVERVTCEVAKEVMREVPGGVPGFEPFIRYHTFADFSINFTVILRAKEFVDNYLIKHEFIKRLHERFAKEGIIIPYPIRAINYQQEKAQ
jgi:small-conductance mechanosensitive channel